MLPSIVVDCYMGSWSDVVGRKVTLILPPIGAFLGNIVYIVMLLYPNVGVSWICLASFFQGLFGSFTSVFTGVLALISSITNENNRTARISVAMSMSFVAGTLGPFLSGAVAQKVNHLSVFILIGICHILAAISAGVFIKVTCSYDVAESA